MHIRLTPRAWRGPVTLTLRTFANFPLVQRNGGTVTLTWDGTRGIPVALELSADLRTWVPVSPQPAGPPYTENDVVTRRYYRLRRTP